MIKNWHLFVFSTTKVRKSEILLVKMRKTQEIYDLLRRNVSTDDK